MKVTKTSPQPAFQPIELNITIESVDELKHVQALWERAGDVRETLLDYECLNYVQAEFLESLLDYIGECL